MDPCIFPIYYSTLLDLRSKFLHKITVHSGICATWNSITMNKIKVFVNIAKYNFNVSVTSTHMYLIEVSFVQ